MTIIFNDDLRTGISIIDDQHQQLFEFINKLDRFKDDKSSFMKTLIELQTYVKLHFKTEEDYMRYAHYPDYKEHKDCHDKFIKDYKS